jgi:hypothetical protein
MPVRVNLELEIPPPEAHRSHYTALQCTASCEVHLPAPILPNLSLFLPVYLDAQTLPKVKGFGREILKEALPLGSLFPQALPCTIDLGTH